MSSGHFGSGIHFCLLGLRDALTQSQAKSVLPEGAFLATMGMIALQHGLAHADVGTRAQDSGRYVSVLCDNLPRLHDFTSILENTL